MNIEEIIELIKESACEVIPELEKTHITMEDSLENLGANSMERADITMLVLERMNLRIPLIETLGPTNIGELAGLLNEKSV